MFNVLGRYSNAKDSLFPSLHDDDDDDEDDAAVDVSPIGTIRSITRKRRRRVHSIICAPLSLS